MWRPLAFAFKFIDTLVNPLSPWLPIAPTGFHTTVVFITTSMSLHKDF